MGGKMCGLFFEWLQRGCFAWKCVGKSGWNRILWDCIRDRGGKAQEGFMHAWGKSSSHLKDKLLGKWHQEVSMSAGIFFVLS